MNKVNDFSRKVLTTTRDVLYAITHLKRRTGEKRNDPLVVLRFKTSLKAAIAALLTFMFVVIPVLRLVARQRLYAVMQSIIVTLLVHQSLQGVVRNSYDMLRGGMTGIISGYVTWLVSPNLYVSLAIFFVFVFFVGVHDPALLRPLFMRISVWDFMVIVFFPRDNQKDLDIMHLAITHLTMLLCIFIPFLLFWPNLSSRQFMKEFRVCCNDCLGLFRSLTPYMNELSHKIREDESPLPFSPSFGSSPHARSLSSLPLSPPSEAPFSSPHLPSVLPPTTLSLSSPVPPVFSPSHEPSLSPLPLSPTVSHSLSPSVPLSPPSRTATETTLSPPLSSSSPLPSSSSPHHSSTSPPPLLSSSTPHLIINAELNAHSESATENLNAQGLWAQSETLEETLLEESLQVRMSKDVALKNSETDFRRNLTRLNRVIKEVKWEIWNGPIIRDYEKLIQTLELCLHKLTALKQASSKGLFTGPISLHFLLPMVPFFEELQTQIDSNLENLSGATTIDANDIDRIIEQMNVKYNEVAREYESVAIAANPTSSFTRMIFLLFGTSELAADISRIEKTVRNLPEYQNQNSAIEFLSNFYKDYHPIVAITPFYQSFLLFFVALPQWRQNLKAYGTSRAWVFPLQLALGCTVVVFFMVRYQITIFPVSFWNGLWTCITFEIVILPSLGATLKRSWHRVLGTIAGAYIGFLCLFSVAGLWSVPKDIILSVLLLFLITIFSYLHQVPRYAYSGTCAAFTFLLVIDGQYDAEHPDVWFATMRTLHIMIGLAAVLIATLFIFPISSTAQFKKVFLKTSLSIATLIGPAVEQVYATEVNETNRTNVMQLRNNVQSLHVLKKQTKPELIFKRNGYKNFHESSERLLTAYYALISVHSAASCRLLPHAIEMIMNPLKPQITALISSISSSAQNMLLEPSDNAANTETLSITEAIVALDEVYLEIRWRLLREKHYYNLHPDLRKVSEFVYTLRYFAKHWVQLEANIKSTFNK